MTSKTRLWTIGFTAVVSANANAAIDHYLAWEVVPHVTVNFTVKLSDQFLDPEFIQVNLDRIVRFSNAANQDNAGYIHQDNHFDWYRVIAAPNPCPKQVTFSNKFGVNQSVKLDSKERYLLVPTRKGIGPSPQEIDHYLCYVVIEGVSVAQNPLIEDQFLTPAQNMTITFPRYFCNPVEKIHDEVTTPIVNPNDFLVFYENGLHPAYGNNINAKDQFNDTLGWTLPITNAFYLGVPSVKVSESCIPAVSEWGLAVMGILVLTAATVVIQRRRAGLETGN